MKKYIYHLFWSGGFSYVRTTIKMPEFEEMLNKYRRQQEDYNIPDMIIWFREKGYNVEAIKPDFEIYF